MKANPKAKATLSDIKLHVKVRISAMWSSLMFCYIYGDYFGLYVPGKLQDVLKGVTPLGPTSPTILLTEMFLLSVPAAMIFLTLALPPAASRWLNIGLGIVYTITMLLTLPGAWTFYIYIGVVDVALTALIVWSAVTWPRIPVAQTI